MRTRGIKWLANAKRKLHSPIHFRATPKNLMKRKRKHFIGKSRATSRDTQLHVYESTTTSHAEATQFQLTLNEDGHRHTYPTAAQSYAKKRVDAIPYSMTNTNQILNQFLRNRDGCQAHMTIMKRCTPRLGQLPPKMEPAWTLGMTPMEYANTLQTCIKRQENLGRTCGDFQIISTMAQRAMEHAACYDVGSNRVTQLVQMAANYEDFKDIVMTHEDSPHSFATMLESHSHTNQQRQINMMSTAFEPSINKFERNTGRNGTGARNARDNDKDRKPREPCPCCLRHGHNIEKGSACWMGAQTENVLKYNKDNPERAKENMKIFKTALNPATIAKMQLRFPNEFRGLELDSSEMLEAAVSVFEIFHRTEE
jgi:hypothetical protein